MKFLMKKAFEAGVEHAIRQLLKEDLVLLGREGSAASGLKVYIDVNNPSSVQGIVSTLLLSSSYATEAMKATAVPYSKMGPIGSARCLSEAEMAQLRAAYQAKQLAESESL